MKVLVVLALVLFTALPVCAFELGSRGMLDTPAPPRPISPIKEEAAVTSGGSLEFKWRDMYAADTDYYDFKLYKGYERSEASLISHEKVSERDDSVKISADSFQDGQVYTWSIVRVTLSGRKSDRVYNSFKAVKK